METTTAQIAIGNLTTILIPGKHEKEFEIHAPDGDDFGYNVTVHYKRLGFPEKVTHYNCTEIHWLFNLGWEFSEEDKVAIESDIHRTGGTRRLADIRKVVIKKATQLAENW